MGPVTLQSPHLLFMDITQTSTTDPTLESFGSGSNIYGPYGEPTLSGDSLLFNAPYFSSFVFPGPAVDVTDGFLTFGIQAEPGTTISQLAITEFGAISLFSPLGGSTLTSVRVAAPAFATINEIVLNDGSTTGLSLVLDSPIILNHDVELTPPGNSLPGWDGRMIPR